MATVNKDFRVKSGLVVEGTTGTINGNDILTKSASDQYILDLIGGETLVKSVSSELSVDGSGQLSIDRNVTDDWYDASGEAFAAELNAKNYADGLASNYDPAGSAFDAQQNAEGYTDAQLTNYTTTANLDTTIDGYGYLKSADLTGYATESYVDQAETDAKAYADSLINDASNLSTEVWSAYKTNTEIGLAQSAAESYADTAIANLVDSAPATLDTLNELAAALQDNPDIITDLQDIAAGKQDTLTAGSNIDITGATISVTGLDTADVAEDASNLYFTNSRAVDAVIGLNNSDYYPLAEKDGKAGVYKPTVASTLGTEAINGSGIKVSGTNTSALAIDRTTVDTWYDASGTAQGIVDALDTDDIEEGVNNLYYTDARAKAEAKALLLNADKTNIQIVENLAGGINIVAENGVADSTTDDLDEGSTNLYFNNGRAIDAINGNLIQPEKIDIAMYRREEATQQYVSAASTVNVHSFEYPYESVKYLVRVVGWDGGVKHSQITEILMTVDGNKNIAITEYGSVHTSTNPLATFSATDLGTPAVFNPALTATTAVTGCEIIAAATMLSWAD